MAGSSRDIDSTSVLRILPVNDLLDQHINRDEERIKQWQRCYADQTNLFFFRVQCSEYLVDSSNSCWQQIFISWADPNFLPNGNLDINKVIFKKACADYNTVCEKSKDADQLVKRRYYEDFENEYMGREEEFVQLLKTGLKREEEMVEKWKNPQPMEVEIVSPRMEVLAMIKTLKDGQKLQELQKEGEKLELLFDDVEGEQIRMREITQTRKINGITDMNKRIQFKQDSAKEQSKTVKDMVVKIYQMMEKSVGILCDDLKLWKDELMKFHVELLQKSPDIDPELAICCSEVAELLNMVQQSKWTQLTAKMEDCAEMEQLKQDFLCLLQRLLSMSFVVKSQCRAVKVSLGKKKDMDADGDQGNTKFKCDPFEAEVCLPAAKSFQVKTEVVASFHSEEELRRLKEDVCGALDESFPLNQGKAKWDGKANAKFKKMTLQKYERKNQEKVVEEKYRLIFRTTISLNDAKIKLETMSLPIVVYTGASQMCNAMGSLLWQCYTSIDIDQPCGFPQSLPCSEVMAMLNEKLKTLGGRELQEDEKQHLKERLLKVQNSEDCTADPLITFQSFCVEKMMDVGSKDEKKKSVTFWMWFKAIHNLLSSYLKEYWTNGHIHGFLKKDLVKKNLLATKKEKVFMLRFSDNIVTDCQGQSLCGAISVCTTQMANGKLSVNLAEPFIAEKLKKRQLAKMLITAVDNNRDPLLEFIYPGDATLKETFEPYLKEKRDEKDKQYYYTWSEQLQLNTSFSNMSLSESKDCELQNRKKKKAKRRYTESAGSTQSKKHQPDKVPDESPSSVESNLTSLQSQPFHSPRSDCLQFSPATFTDSQTSSDVFMFGNRTPDQVVPATIPQVTGNIPNLDKIGVKSESYLGQQQQQQQQHQQQLCQFTAQPVKQMTVDSSPAKANPEIVKLLRKTIRSKSTSSQPQENVNTFPVNTTFDRQDNCIGTDHIGVQTVFGGGQAQGPQTVIIMEGMQYNIENAVNVQDVQELNVSSTTLTPDVMLSAQSGYLSSPESTPPYLTEVVLPHEQNQENTLGTLEERITSAESSPEPLSSIDALLECLPEQDSLQGGEISQEVLQAFASPQGIQVLNDMLKDNKFWQA